MIISSIKIIYLFVVAINGLGLEDSLSDFGKPYYCSTCFTNTQYQNYHCCFYFFKCCAEARRGSKSTTPSPQYPGLPKTNLKPKPSPPCLKECKENEENFSATTEEESFNVPQADSNVQYGQPVSIHTVNITHAGYSLRLRTLNISDLPYQEVNDTTEDESDFYGLGIPSKEDPKSSGSSHVGIESSALGLASKNSDFEDKIFLPPPIALRYRSRKQASKSETAGEKTLGWFTRELLDGSDKYKDTSPVSVSDESTIIWG